MRFRGAEGNMGEAVPRGRPWVKRPRLQTQQTQRPLNKRNTNANANKDRRSPEASPDRRSRTHHSGEAAPSSGPQRASMPRRSRMRFRGAEGNMGEAAPRGRPWVNRPRPRRPPATGHGWRGRSTLAQLARRARGCPLPSNAPRRFPSPAAFVESSAALASSCRRGLLGSGPEGGSTPPSGSSNARGLRPAPYEGALHCAT